MTSATLAPQAARPLSPRVSPTEGWRQTMTLAWRTIVQVRHNPWELGDFSFQPILFVLMFNFVFGGAIAGDADAYLPYMLPGIIAMNMLFVTMYVGTGLNTDVTKGVFDRLRSLPIARWAPLAGRIIADQAKQAWSIFLIVGIGLALGFRFTNGFLPVVAAIALLLVFALAFSWVSVFVGMMARDPEQVQMVGVTALFPIAFVSTVFVPADTMPGWLEAFVNVNPVSHLADATRGLMLGSDSVQAFTGNSVAVGESVFWSLVSAGIIVAIFAPLSVWAFKRRI